MGLLNYLTEWYYTVKLKKPVEISTDYPPQHDEVDEIVDTTQFVTELPEGVCSTIYQSGDRQDSEKTGNYWITQYRLAELYPEVRLALREIIGDAIITDDAGKIVQIDLQNCELPEKIEKLIEESFEKILRLLKFNKKGEDIFRRWYIDGKLYYNVVVDNDNLKKGIQKLIYIDPLRINLVEEKERKNRKKQTGAQDWEPRYHYEYTDDYTNKMVRVDDLSLVVYCGSGVWHRLYNIEVSNLQYAIKAINNLRNIEDHIIIYRLTRSIERRKFAVQVGHVNKTKAEEHVEKLRMKFRNDIAYDRVLGTVASERNKINMIQDYWFPINADGKGSDVSIVEGGKNLGELEDLYYFIEKVWRDLGIPLSRRELDKNRPTYDSGHSGSIEHDEVNFAKYITSLRNKFCDLFLELLGRELIFKQIMNKAEYENIRDHIQFKFTNDNLYEELKEIEINTMRLDLLSRQENYVGKYYTKDDIALKTLKFTESEWKEKQAALAQAKTEKDAETATDLGGLE